MPKPDSEKYRQAKRRLRKFLRTTIAECEQIGRDIEWWNANRTDAPPFDRGGGICAARLANEILLLLETDQLIPIAKWERLREQLEANANG